MTKEKKKNDNTDSLDFFLKSFSDEFLDLLWAVANGDEKAREELKATLEIAEIIRPELKKTAGFDDREHDSS